MESRSKVISDYLEWKLEPNLSEIMQSSWKKVHPVSSQDDSSFSNRTNWIISIILDNKKANKKAAAQLKKVLSSLKSTQRVEMLFPHQTIYKEAYCCSYSFVCAFFFETFIRRCRWFLGTHNGKCAGRSVGTPLKNPLWFASVHLHGR